MGWSDIPTGEIVVWLNNIGQSIPWLNDSGIVIEWRGTEVLGWQQIPTPQQPYWGTLILKWKNNSSTVLAWSNNTGTLLKWRSNQLNPQPFYEPNAFWTTVPT